MTPRAMGGFIGPTGAILSRLATFLTPRGDPHNWGWTFGRCVQRLKGAPARADTPSVRSLCF
jgi:hypothetical protein